MRCVLRGERITYSPRTCDAVRRYCSSESVSAPRRTMNAPLSCAAASSAPKISGCMGPRSGDADGLHCVVALAGVHDVHALRDLAEHRVHAVQVTLRGVADEELAAARVLAGVGHG